MTHPPWYLEDGQDVDPVLRSSRYSIPNMFNGIGRHARRPRPSSFMMYLTSVYTQGLPSGRGRGQVCIRALTIFRRTQLGMQCAAPSNCNCHGIICLGYKMVTFRIHKISAPVGRSPSYLAFHTVLQPLSLFTMVYSPAVLTTCECDLTDKLTKGPYKASNCMMS